MFLPLTATAPIRFFSGTAMCENMNVSKAREQMYLSTWDNSHNLFLMVCILAVGKPGVVVTPVRLELCQMRKTHC